MSQDGEHDHVYKPYQNVEGPHYDAFLQTPETLNGLRRLYLGVYHNCVHWSKVTSDDGYTMPANARPFPCIFPDGRRLRGTLERTPGIWGTGTYRAKDEHSTK